MAHLLGCENVTVDYPSKTVLDAVTLGIDEGDRIGIVGANGDGKSTLLRLLAGELAPDRGRVVARSGLRVAMLGQTDSLDPASTVAHAVVGERLKHEWASDARVRAIIHGLIGDVEWGSAVGELSGGQRRRVDLARVLVEDSDVLLLDEPTNHLDIHGIAWLAEHLKTRWPRRTGALLVVTHDRWFLDEVCARMWEVHDGRVDRFEGGYSAYLLQRVERAEAARTAEQKRRNTLRRELAWLARRPQARGTKPKFRIDAANALIADEPPARDSLELKRTAMSRLGKQVIDLDGVSERFGNRTVIEDVTWHIGAGDRIGLLGGNGSGKTTLMSVIRGALAPSSGTVRIGSTVKFAVLTQHLAELDVHADERVREVLSRYHTRYEIDGAQLTPAQLLERLGFESAQLQAYVRTLSGGEKRRLQLMLILLDRPNVLVLDEPDNDLDTDMLALVEEMLDTWPGTLLLVTHDRQLMERVTDDQFALVGGRLRHMPGGVDEYLRLLDLLEERGGGAAPASAGRPAAARTVPEPAAPEPDDEPGAAPRLARADEYAARKALASTERRMSTAARKVDEALEALAATDPYDPGALIAAQRTLTEVEDQLSELENEWLRLSELLG